MDKAKSGQVLIIAGMHRSGTSFVSSILKEAGLHVGERLSPGEAGNTKGFFENTDFVKLHAKILKNAGLNAWSLDTVKRVSPELREEAIKTVSDNSQPGPWGWKDPRTTLFLDFWMELLPDAKFLFVFRSPWEVVDSLFRRGDKAFQEDPVLALKVWEHYNRLSIDFYNRHKDRSLLAHVDAVATDPAPLVDALRNRLSLPLSMPASTTFDKSMFKTEPKGSHRPALVRECFPEIFQLWEDLENSTELKPANHNGCNGSAPDFGKQVFTDWMELRKTQSSLSKLEKALGAAQSDLDQSNQRIEWIERSKIWKIRSKLNAIRELLLK
ncbi:MAG: sulfotransferase [Candidatus Obscuribacterales bacterium]|nr:sulfotransferase [Candidatus Obscuribacterales bacterium]